MGPLKCCVGGCSATSETHRILVSPRTINLHRALWLSFVVPTNSLLIILSKEQLLRKRVCEKHFDKHQFDDEDRRLRYSYPCLLTEAEIAHGVPLNDSGWDVTSEHNYGKKQNEDGVIELDMSGIADWVSTNDHNYYSKDEDEDRATKTSDVHGRAEVVSIEASCSFTKENVTEHKNTTKPSILSRRAGVYLYLCI